MELHEAFANRMRRIFQAKDHEPLVLDLIGKLLSKAVPALVQMAQEEWPKVLVSHFQMLLRAVLRK